MSQIKPRYVARFVNGVHVVLDTHTYRHVSLHGLRVRAEEAAARRNDARS